MDFVLISLQLLMLLGGIVVIAGIAVIGLQVTYDAIREREYASILVLMGLWIACISGLIYTLIK